MRSLNRKAALIGSFILAIALVAPPLTRGDESNTATSFTIDRPFEVPGMVLQPNTAYVIALIEAPAARNVVQIYNEDQTKMLTAFMAISSERAKPADTPVFTFIKTEPEFPLPIKEWFYPGYQHGLQFVYPKEQALKIAGYAREPILSANTTDLDALNTVEVETINHAGEQPQMDKAAMVSLASLSQDNESYPIQRQPEDRQEQSDANASEAVSEAETNQQLPATAGELPLVALIGLLCIGAGLGMKVLSAKSYE